MKSNRLFNLNFYLPSIGATIYLEDTFNNIQRKYQTYLNEEAYKTMQPEPSKLFKLLQSLFNCTKYVTILAGCDFYTPTDYYTHPCYDETGSMSLQMFDDLLDRACSKRTIQYQPSKLFRLLQSIFN